MKFKKILYLIVHFKLIRSLIAYRNKNKAIIENDDKKYLINYGYLTLGYKMNLNQPKTFNEKLNWYKLNYCNELMRRVVDKIEVKKYIIEKNLQDILIPTIAEYDSISSIDFEKLPNQFIIKNTMDSGGVFVCRDKSTLKFNDITNKLSSYISNEFVDGKHWAREYAYVPNSNRIIIEELIKTPDGHAPWDYKFFCFNGEPRFLFVGSDRDTNVCFDFFDIDFNWIPVKQGHPNSNKVINKPKNYKKMIDICRTLSKDFPHVRVDLYNIDGEIFFGELTFYHFAGFKPFKPKKWDKIFGDMWDLNAINFQEK